MIRHINTVASDLGDGDLLRVGVSTNYVLVSAADLDTSGRIAVTIYNGSTPGTTPNLHFKPDHPVALSMRRLRPSDTPAAPRVYCRTFSATTKHVENPDRPGRTLCGHAVCGYARNLYAHQSWQINDLPECEKCDTSARKRNLGEMAATFLPEPPRVIRYNQRFTGKVCIESAYGADDESASTLCGYGAMTSARLRELDGRKVCPECQAAADREGYKPAGGK